MLIFRRREYGIKRRVRAPERERERRAMKVELTIPDNRAGSEQWIQGQSTEVVADVFDMARELSKCAGSFLTMRESFSLQEVDRMHKEQMQEKDDALQIMQKQNTRLEEEVKQIARLTETKTLELNAKRIELTEEFHRKQMETTASQNASAIELLRREFQIARADEVARYESELTRLRANSTDGLHFAAILKESTSVLKQYTRDVNSGFAGENLIRQVFDNEINKGFLEDTSRSTEAGAEDYLWSFDARKANIEVKWKAAMHSKDDILKHETRISEASRMGKISLGIFFSLQCKIPNKPSIALEVHSGIPVLYVSKTDGTTPESLVAIGFRIAIAVWHRLEKEEEFEEDVSLVYDVVQSLQGIVSRLDKQQAIIFDLRRQLNYSYKSLEQLERLKNEMIGEIESVRTSHSTLCPAREEQEESHSLGDSDPIQMVLEYLEENRKYPTCLSQLPLRDCGQEISELVKQAKRHKKRQRN